jgi:nucleoside-diphosphate-sugar epimerase
MRVLVLGGTWSIGAPVVRELVRGGHEVTALARSRVSAQRLTQLGAQPLAGDISAPRPWLDLLRPVDGVIHAAATFDENEEATERCLLDGLLPFLYRDKRGTKFIYTGGCWLFGATGGVLVNEDAPFHPPPACSYAVTQIRRVFGTAGVHAVVIHPAMVYEPQGGVFARFRSDAVERDAVRVAASEHVRWPLVHADDLAVLYRLALEDGRSQVSYIGAAIDGLQVGRIARAFARRYGSPRSDPEIISEDAIVMELGEWARGYALDQCLSGRKAQQILGWQPRHLDPESEIASLD